MGVKKILKYIDFEIFEIFKRKYWYLKENFEILNKF